MNKECIPFKIKTYGVPCFQSFIILKNLNKQGHASPFSYNPRLVKCFQCCISIWMLFTLGWTQDQCLIFGIFISKQVHKKVLLNNFKNFVPQSSTNECHLIITSSKYFQSYFKAEKDFIFCGGCKLNVLKINQ